MKAPGRFSIISLSLDHLSSTERPVAKQFKQRQTRTLCRTLIVAMMSQSRQEHRETGSSRKDHTKIGNHLGAGQATAIP